MIVRPCLAEDIHFILSHPWDITKKELENFGYDKKYTHSELSELYLKYNFGNSYVAIDDTGYPIVAFGMAISTNTDWVCWSLRSDRYPENFKETTKIFNDYLQKGARWQREKDGTFTRIIMITSVDSLAVEKWCKIIGFKRTTGNGIKEQYSCDVGVYVREFY